MAPTKHRQPLAAADSNIGITSTGLAATTEGKQSAKRKAANIEEPETLPEIDSDDDRLRMVDQNCDQIRRKIRAFITSGEMKVGEFQKTLGVNSNSYGRFMGQSGPYKGSGSSVYVEAFSFFKKRELQGIKPPKKKVKKEDEQRNTVDLSGITLDGESSDQVEIYDTCDEVRKKINAYLQEPHVTQAGFCREISKTFSSGKKVSAKNLTDFLGKRGPRAGNTSAAYYAAYVFFEKLRLKNGKAKSRHREEMESIHGQEGGMDTKISSSRGYLCLGNERPREDKFGRVTFY